MKNKNLLLVFITLLLSSCNETEVTIRSYIETIKEDVILNKCIYSCKENESKIVTYISKGNRPIVAKDDSMVDYFDTKMLENSVFKEGYTIDSNLKDNEVIVPSSILLDNKDVKFSDGTTPSEVLSSKENDENKYTTVFTKILEEQLQYKFYVDVVGENKNVNYVEIPLTIVGIYNFDVEDIGMNKSVYEIPKEYGDYSLYSTAIVSSTLFDSLKDYNSKGVNR